jgi:hypothetical protein
MMVGIEEIVADNRIKITPEHLDIAYEILQGRDNGLPVHEIVDLIHYQLKIYDLNRSTFGNNNLLRKRIKNFLKLGPQSTAEIIEHVNNTTRHGTTSPIVVNIVSKDIDIVQIGKTKRLGSRYGSYNIAVWTLKVFIKFEHMISEDKRFEQEGDTWKAATRKMGKATCAWCEAEIVEEEWLIKKRQRRSDNLFCSSQCQGLFNVKVKTLMILVMAHDGMEANQIADEIDMSINNVMSAIKRHYGNINALRESDITPIMRMIEKKG